MSRTLMPLAAVLFTTGCIPVEDLDDWAAVAHDALQEIAPEVSFQDLQLTGLDFDGADGEFTFRVDNPNGVGLNLSSFEWALDLGDRRFVDGVQDNGLTIEPWGSTEIVVPVSVDFTDLIGLIGVAEGVDSVPWSLTGAFGFEGIFDEVRVPFEHVGDFPALRRPETTLSRLRLEQVDWWGQEADLAVDVQIGNPGGPIGVDGFFYAIELEGHEVASGWLGSLSSLEGAETRDFTLPIGLDLREAGAAVLDALTDDEAGLEVTLVAVADVSTPFGTVPWETARSKTLSLE